MSMDAIFKDAKEKMTKSIDALKQELVRLRTGRATPALLDGIKVEYYGAQTPLNQVGNVSVPDPKMIMIQPWDTSAIQAIEKAILKSELGLNPQSDGKIVRIPIPDLTDERRKDLVKHIKKLAEDTKIAIRKIRQNSNDAIKKLEKDKLASEDEVKKGQDVIQKHTDEFIVQADKLIATKEKEILQS